MPNAAAGTSIIPLRKGLKARDRVPDAVQRAAFRVLALSNAIGAVHC
jgi:hypothetical protein